LQIGCGLLDSRLGPSGTRGLLAVVEAGEHRTFGDAVADIGVQFDQNARDLESDFGRYAGLNGTEPEYVDPHVTLNGRDLYFDRAEICRPRTEQNAGADHNSDACHNQAP
jgi:hypothetical protein